MTKWIFVESRKIKYGRLKNRKEKVMKERKKQ